MTIEEKAIAGEKSPTDDAIDNPCQQEVSSSSASATDSPFLKPMTSSEIGSVVARNVIAGAVVPEEDSVLLYDRHNARRMRIAAEQFEENVAGSAITSSVLAARRKAMSDNDSVAAAPAAIIAIVAIVAVIMIVLSVPRNAMASVLDTDQVQGKTYIDLGVDQ